MAKIATGGGLIAALTKAAASRSLKALLSLQLFALAHGTPVAPSMERTTMDNRQLLRAAWAHDKGGLFAVLLVPVGLWVAGLFTEIL